MFVGVHRGIIKRDSQERRPIGQRLAAIITQFNLILQIFDVIPIQNATETHWSTELAQAIKSPAELWPLLGLTEQDLPAAHKAMASFKMLVPRPFVSRMEFGNVNDPLLKQVLADDIEMLPVAGYSKDPLDEGNHNPQKAIVHKYERRILVITTGTCAVNCRYCFRRHFPYGDNQLAQKEWDSVIDYLKDHPEVNEVILSGGDPLMLKDSQLSQHIARLNDLPQLKRLRIHSRLPVVIPSRINDELLAWVSQSRLDVVLVLHSNHAHEIDQSIADKVALLKRAGVTVLNQGVLLRGVNDSVEAQVNLSEALFAAGILPYYMFTFDPIEGGAHFDISIEAAQQLMGQVAQKLPGYLMPKLAKEIPGEPAKTVLAPRL
ncbi:L-lysine 2,3-aminomutase [Marinomonas aquimarina]|uniref:L-lysine 2,3-aminomutase n=1 Tax=Marinomonas aquimarina TaxID=295068 RepID=A0A1A8T9F5_9GAMM|nr:L-lysine 2,3-aminomutase [Marinomonas aquimarina]